jgi:hypothetical protein
MWLQSEERDEERRFPRSGAAADAKLLRATNGEGEAVEDLIGEKVVVRVSRPPVEKVCPAGLRQPRKEGQAQRDKLALSA